MGPEIKLVLKTGPDFFLIANFTPFKPSTPMEKIDWATKSQLIPKMDPTYFTFTNFPSL